MSGKPSNDNLDLAYRHVLHSGDAILSYDPETDIRTLEQAMDLLGKIGLLYIDHQLLLAQKRHLVRTHLDKKKAPFPKQKPK